VLARSSARDTVFLAHLFLGRINEDAGRLDDAARAYEAALALHPRCQSARLALSHLLWRRGDAAGARREVEAALQPAGEGQHRDPFWQYPWGTGVGAEERLEALRREVSW
jgi:cytochrome c-type biogenesis protein CcmH/NrfG